MTDRENLMRLLRREGYERVPVDFSMCPALEVKFRDATGISDYRTELGFPMEQIPDLILPDDDRSRFHPYHHDVGPDLDIDTWGVGHRTMSREAMHMTRFQHPLAEADSVEQILAYPYPDYFRADESHLKTAVDAIHARGKVARGSFEAASWELCWYIRGMDNLFVDMMTDEPMAEALFDAVNLRQIHRAVAFARAGADIIHFGDDVGMQHTPMMSLSLYEEWIAPRLTRLCRAVKEANPDTLIFYHSCGFIEPFIPSLLKSGIDILDPVQPESMDFARLHAEYGNAVSFHGTLGTQTLMPFGTPAEVRDTVRRNLDIAGTKGGLFPAPTHLLEPEVPVENILAYVEACRDYTC